MLTKEQVMKCIKEESVVFATFSFYENYNPHKHNPIAEVIIKKYVKDNYCEIEYKKEEIVYKEIVPFEILFFIPEAFNVLLGMFDKGKE